MKKACETAKDRTRVKTPRSEPSAAWSRRRTSASRVPATETARALAPLPRELFTAFHRVSQILSCGTYEGQCTVGPHLGQLAGSSAASRHSTRAAARHDHSTSQSVSQLFHGPAPRSDPSPTSDHSLLLKGRLRCRPLSAVLTASCAQGSRPRGFLSGTQFGGTGPRHWYAVGTPRAQETGR